MPAVKYDLELDLMSYFVFLCSGDYSNALLHYEKGVTKLPEVCLGNDIISKT